MTPQEQLNADAEEHALIYKRNDNLDCLLIGAAFYSFESGALSSTAANGCNKHVEMKVIQAQVDLIDSLYDLGCKDILEFRTTPVRLYTDVLNPLKDKLNQQLETLKQQQ